MSPSLAPAVPESTITSKGQTTVPTLVRARIAASPGTRLLWHVLPDGSVIVRAKQKSILDLAGSLALKTKKKKVAVDDMNPWR